MRALDRKPRHHPRLLAAYLLAKSESGIGMVGCERVEDGGWRVPGGGCQVVVAGCRALNCAPCHHPKSAAACPKQRLAGLMLG